MQKEGETGPGELSGDMSRGNCPNPLPTVVYSPVYDTGVDDGNLVTLTFDVLTV